MHSLRILYIAASLSVMVCFGMHALALSCLPSTPQDTFKNLDSVDDEYHIFEGQITPLQTISRNQDPLGKGIPQTIRARFTGRGLGPDGLAQQSSRFDLNVNLQCAAHWCGGFPSTTQNIYFLKYQANGTYSLTMSPCGGSSFEASRQNRQTLIGCFRSGCSNDASNPVIIPQPPTPPQPIAQDTCGKDLLSELVGTHSRSLPAFLRKNSSVRLIAPDTMVTHDYRVERLNIHTSYKGVIEKMRCG